MCGLFGWAVKQQFRGDLPKLKRLTDMLVHRGPDGGGYWLSDGANLRYQIGLGHRRLSIIDLTGGTQPMTSKDGRYTLVFNGEIYNYLELRDQLEQAGHLFQTSSDTEVIVESYRAWGIEAFPRFRGMFAIALWDCSEGALILARDPFGKKPLFYANVPDQLIFGSEIAPILALIGSTGTVDASAVNDYFLNRYIAGPHTFFPSVKKISPGCLGIWRNGELKFHRYFDLPLLHAKPEPLNFAEASDLFTQTMDEAVRLRMRSDAPFGAFLSGGIDSSTIVTTMMRHSGTRLRTFSVGFDDDRESELSYAAQVAELCGTEHRTCIVGPQEFAECWPLATIRRGAPVSEPSDIPILLLSKMAADHVKMVLTGEGADELLGGYPKHCAEQYVASYQNIMPEFFHRAVVQCVAKHLPYSMRRTKVLSMALGLRCRQERMRAWFSDMPPAASRELMHWTKLTQNWSNEFVPYEFSLHSASALRNVLFFDQASWLPDNLLERGDRMMMAGSIEGRMPFLDIELANVVARLPDRFLVRNFCGKRILRKVMSGILPANILTRKKIGFRVPIGKWIRGPWRDLARELLTSDQSRVHLSLNAEKITALLHDHLSARENNERTLWSLMSLEMFLRQFELTISFN